MDTQRTQDGLGEGAQRFRIERGAQVLGTDGPLGTVQQVVMDQKSGALRSLVVRGEAGMDYELDAGHIESATGDEVQLTIGRQDLANQPNLARPYAPEQYAPVESGQVMPPGKAASTARQEAEPVLTTIEPDAVEVVAPADTTASATTPSNAIPPTSSAMSAMPTAPTDAEWDEVEAADDLDDLDEGDEVDELEAVIIPGEQPGETDIFIAGAVERPGASDPAAATDGAWIPTRGPQGADYQGPGGRSLAGIAGAAGVLLLAGGAIATYLILRRNQQQTTLGARVRQQTAASAANATALRDTLRNQANTWLPAAAGSLAALRDQAAARGSALSDTLRRQARQATDASSRAVAPGGPARQTARQAASRASDLGNRLGDRLASGWRQAQHQMQHGDRWQWLRDLPDRSTSAWADLSRRAAQATKTTQRATNRAARRAQRATRANADTARRAATDASKAANKRMHEARAIARRGARRMRRRVRWFRNGLLAGVAGGILYAPRPGSATRTTLMGWLRRIPGLDTLLDTYTNRQATVGGTGPRPQTPLAPDMRAAQSGSGTTPARLGTISDQPGGVPLTPDLTPGDIPGI